MAFMIFCKRNVDIICFSQGKRPRVGVSSMPVLRTWGELARKEQFTLGGAEPGAAAVERRLTTRTEAP